VTCWLRRLSAAALLALLAVLLPVSVSWAAHTPAPLPSLEPGQAAVPNGWTCHGETAELTGASSQECQVSGWSVLPAPSPQTVNVEVTHGPVTVEVPTPLPVREVEPGSCLPSPSPAPSPSGDTAEPEPSATPTVTACPVVLEQGQAFGLWLFLGALLVLAIFTVIRREGRGFRVG
jgi:hypothetical protein